MRVIEFFTPDEFTCDGKLCYLEMDEKLIAMLDYARELAGVPMKITSSWRTKAHNEKVGGSPDSAHLKGKAVDIACGSGRDRWLIVKALEIAGFRRIGIARNFIHVDIDDTKPQNVMWIY